MSVRSVVDFWRSVQTNPELQAKLAKLEGDLNVGGAEIARAAGFDVNAQEMRDVDTVVAFWDRVERDEALRQKLAPAHESDSPETAMREIAKVARTAGFELPPEALQLVTGALVNAGADQTRLSEAQLDAVAGGAPNASPPSGPGNSSLDRARGKKWEAPKKVGPGVVGAKP